MSIPQLALTFYAPVVFIGPRRAGFRWAQQALKGDAVAQLLQALDNAADGHLRARPSGEIFSTFYPLNKGCRLYPGCHCSVVIRSADVEKFINLIEKIS
jgi:hypothetical protein